MQALQSWTIVGKASFRSPQDSASASLKWEHQAHRWQFSGNGSFGRGAFRAEQSSAGAMLWQSGEGEFTGASVAELLRQNTGMDLPLEKLEYWIKGLAAPGPIEEQERNEQAEFVRLVQEGWEVQYRSYDTWQTLRLPTKIFIQSKNMELRLVIHQWQFPKEQYPDLTGGSVEQCQLNT